MAKQFWEFAVWILSLLSAATAFPHYMCRISQIWAVNRKVLQSAAFGDSFGLTLKDSGLGLKRSKCCQIEHRSTPTFRDDSWIEPTFNRHTFVKHSTVLEIRYLRCQMLHNSLHDSTCRKMSFGSALKEGKFEFQIPPRDKTKTNRFFDVSTFYHYLFAFWCRRKMILLYFLRCRLPRDQLPRVD